MGLAAAQSRFLLLTSRQNNLASRMSLLQNESLALQRQTAILSQEYNKKQNASLVTFNEQPLDYAALMKPCDNGFNHMITDSSGAVVLTNVMAGKLNLGSQGDGSAFTSKIKSPLDLMTRLGGYSGTDTVSTENKDLSSENNAYKYDDNIMNNAIVSVQASSILGVGGYLFDSEGNIDQNASLEYTMGTQQRSVSGSQTGGLSSLVPIYTLDKFQYTESNVHSVTNEFVASSCKAMGDVMASTLGATDAVTNAISYATEMTKEKYAATEFVSTDKDIDQFRQLAEAGTFYDDESNPSAIYVSTKPYESTTTTGVSFEGDKTNFSRLIDIYDGKDVYIDTAQLTATFLMYFDIGMMKELGSEASTASAKYLEERMAGEKDVISLREDIRESGLSYFAMDDSLCNRNVFRNKVGYEGYPVNEETIIQYREITRTTIINAGTPKEFYMSTNGAESFFIKVKNAKGEDEFIDFVLDEKTKITDAQGNVTYKKDKNGNYTYIANVRKSNVSSSEHFTFDYLTISGNGSNVIGQYGNQSKLSDNFTEAACGVFGSKNTNGNDFNSFVYASSSSSSSSKSTEADNEYAKTYYNGLYNALAAGGWTVDGKVGDSAYLSEQMLQGNMVLQQFNNSQSWAVLQLGDSDNGLDTVDDKETREKAKSEYDAKQAIMKTKETFIENEIKSLETQSQAFESEQETIKAIIEKEQEKLKLFVSG